jgi:hypothetical protein
MIPILVVYSLIFSHNNNNYFSIDTEHYSRNVRELIWRCPDSIATCLDLKMDSTRMYCLTPYSLEYGEDSISIWEGDKSEFYHKYPPYPLFVHRADGRTDTLSDMCGRIPGYVQRKYEDDEWLIVEIKQAYKILGRAHLVDKRSWKNGHPYLDLANYDFKGQKIVFNSKLSDFWIASKHSSNLYGPLNTKELKRMGKSLGISFPITLDGLDDVYAQPVNHDGSIADRRSERPKDYAWYHHTRRPDRVIR